jgi:hypothetical protein
MTSQIKLRALPGQASPFKTIIYAGLAAGVLDAAAGVIVYYIWFKFNPMQVLQFISTGVFGPSAMSGGLATAIAGLILHFIIALSIAAIYFFSYPKIKVLGKFAVASGLFFGLAVWLVMNLIIVPHSNVPASPFDAGLAAVGIVWHMVLVGLPIALITKHYYSSVKAALV